MHAGRGTDGSLSNVTGEQLAYLAFTTRRQQALAGRGHREGSAELVRPPAV
jgi:hypothetical protein